MISGGCLESALIHESLNCIASNQLRLIRYGKDSDYFDIQLPCGSGIDVLITPNIPDQTIESLFTSYQHRSSVEWTADLNTALMVRNPKEGVLEQTPNRQLSRQALESTFSGFSHRYNPRTRIVLVGEGAIFDYFLAMAQLFDVEVCAYSNAANVKDVVKASLDEHSAFVTLSHDHELEPELLSEALSTDAFYIGALGSRKTHQRRLDLLAQLGFTENQLHRIHGPVGINLGGRTPPDIALSIMAEIVKVKSNAR